MKDELALLKSKFEEHHEYLASELNPILDRLGLNGLVLDSGRPIRRFLDDQNYPFRPNFYFNYFCPLESSGHFVVFKKNSKPTLYFLSPDDIWHDEVSREGDWWQCEFEINVISQADKRSEIINGLGLPVIASDMSEFAGVTDATTIEGLLPALDWMRTKKSDYEVHCIRKANEIAAHGHRAAMNAFFNGASELEAHLNYLNAAQVEEKDLPYASIVAFNNKSATLHYDKKRRERGEHEVFLIDAGARHLGYCSDITRTYCKPQVAPEFTALVNRCYYMQNDICKLVRAGVDYKELNLNYQKTVAKILMDWEILKVGSEEEAIELGLTFAFAPHGLGHPIGLQVHDVGGKQTNASGTPSRPSKMFPYLRTLRNLHEGDVVTIEPGIYFIPDILKPLSTGEHKKTINWKLVEKLIPYGGVRVEDNLVVTKKGSDNLTRAFLPFS